MSYSPEQGDIIEINFDPSAGKEMMKYRPALVLSRKAFNDQTGFAVVAPITSTKRSTGFQVELPEGLRTTGNIELFQMRSLDFKERDTQFIENVDHLKIEIKGKQINLIKHCLSFARLIIS